MKILNKESLLNIIEYEKIRHDYRKEIIDYKINRRIALGPNVTMVFENEKKINNLGFEITAKDFQRPWGGFLVINESQAQDFANKFFDGLNIGSIKIRNMKISGGVKCVIS